SDFAGNALAEPREQIRTRAAGQNVQTFVSDRWTPEYDLARCGLAKEMWLAVQLALADDKIIRGTKTRFGITREDSDPGGISKGRTIPTTNARPTYTRPLRTRVYSSR